ncbi:MAG: hypothetical protein DDT20_00871 [Firmicutes bacterium]|nr:hypothetical protein [Bacillota bacterium]MBT9176551.1 hypothetical protein [Bacillota bacterium]
MSIRQGWKVCVAVKLPPGWELREDEDFLYFYDPDGEEFAYVRHTRPEVTEKDARERSKGREMTTKTISPAGSQSRQKEEEK